MPLKMKTNLSGIKVFGNLGLNIKQLCDNFFLYQLQVISLNIPLEGGY